MTKSPSDYVPFQVRCDHDVHDALTKAAEGSGMSLNKVCVGLLSSIATHDVDVKPGEIIVRFPGGWSWVITNNPVRYPDK